MQMKFLKYPSIDQFRNYLKDANYWRYILDLQPEELRSQLDKIILHGTVKIHGTNACVAYDIKEDKLFFQSRNNIIAVSNDNAGFAQYATDNYDFYKNAIKEIVSAYQNECHESCELDKIYIYGEWAGQGIQKGIALSAVERFFSPFQVTFVKEDTVADCIDFGTGFYESENKIKEILFNEEVRCFPVTVFPTYKVELELDNVSAAQQRIADLTLKIENECPVGKYFNVDGIGEGIVFTSINFIKFYPIEENHIQLHKPLESKFLHLNFKSKGMLHSVSNVKTIAPVDVEKIRKEQEFVEYSVTENRLNQGLEYLKENHLELDTKNIGTFIKWIVSDVMKEEIDTIRENSLSEKGIPKLIGNKAKKWFFNKMKEA